MPEMLASDFLLSAEDGAQLFVRSFLPAEGKPKAVLHIAHGMAEHSERYGRFAQQAVDAGYAVYAADHRGHGKTARSAGDLGYFAEEGVGSSRKVLEEVLAITRSAS